MLRRLNKKGGNRYTIISIIIIILMLYVFKIALGRGGEVNYPQIVYYGDYKYQYSQTIREASFRFVRKYDMSYEGYNLLLKRGEKRETIPGKVYIFVGWRKYREYELYVSH